MRHTPGKWRVGETVGLRRTILSHQDGMIAKVLTKGDLGANANAALIASAPDLLMQLESLVNTWDFAKKHNYVWEMDQDGIEIVREVINKAKGGE